MAPFIVDVTASTSRGANHMIDIYYHPQLKSAATARPCVALRPARVPGSSYPPLMSAEGVTAVYAFYRGVRLTRPALSVADVIDVTHRYYGVSRAAIVGTTWRVRRRTYDALVPFRYVALILATRLTGATTRAIAGAIGQRDSTSVYMAHRYVKRRPPEERWHEDLLLLTAILQDLFEVTPSGRLGALGQGEKHGVSRTVRAHGSAGPATGEGYEARPYRSGPGIGHGHAGKPGKGYALEPAACCSAV